MFCSFVSKSIFLYFLFLLYIFPLSVHITGSHPNNIATSAPRWQDNELEDWGRKGTKQLRINSVESASSGQSSFAVMEVDVAIPSSSSPPPTSHSFCNKPTCCFSQGFFVTFFRVLPLLIYFSGIPVYFMLTCAAVLILRITFNQFKNVMVAYINVIKDIIVIL